MRFKNKNVLVYGLGDSGRAVITLLKNKGAKVAFYDDDLKYFEYVGFERNPTKKQWDFVVLSPGVKVMGNAIIEEFERKNVPILSELDLAYLFSRGKIIAVTGTNGKTTVCMLVNKILKEAGFRTFLCGNIGLPFSAICEKTNSKSIVVCEVSNFQLETSKFFRPNIATILNIKPDHIDRHGSFEEYKKVKSKIAQNLKRRDKLILNFDDEETKKMILHKNFTFFSKKTLKKGVFVKNNQIFVGKKNVLSLNEISLKGEKNLENVLAAVSICSNFNISKGCFSRAICSFKPAQHRMEFVGKIGGVTYIDDSKATNVASTLACLQAFENENIVLLLGGQGKDISYDEIFKNKLKMVVAFGQESQKIFDTAKNFGVKCFKFDHFFDAVEFAIKNSSEGDFCLLSPACASFDEFSSYAERGEKFKQIVLGEKL